MGFSVAFREFRGILRSIVKLSANAGLEGPKKKNNLGRGSKRQVRVKKGLRGQIKRPLPEKKKGPRGPCDPVAAKRRPSKTPKQEGTNPPREALPLALTRARGGRDHPMLCPFRLKKPTRGCPLRLESLLGLLEKVRGRKTERNGEKQNKTQEAEKLPCRLASEKKASEKSRENPKNARGPEWRPDKTPEGKDARPKRENKPVAAGHKKKKKKTQVRVGV